MQNPLSSPAEEDHNLDRTSRLLKTILRLYLILAPPILLLQAAVSEKNAWLWLVMLPIFEGFCLFLLVRLRHAMIAPEGARLAKTRTVSLLTVGFVWACITEFVLATGGIQSHIIWFYLVTVLLAGMLLGGRAGVVMALLCILTTLSIDRAAAARLLPATIILDSSLDFWLVNSAALLSVAVLQYLASHSIRDALAKANRELAERRQAELRLRESEQKYRSLFEQSSLGILMVDESGAIIEYNIACAQITGVPREQALGMNGWDLQYQLVLPEQRTPETYERIKTAFLQTLAAGSSPFLELESEMEFQRPDGAPACLVQKVFAIPTERGFRLATILRDATERKNAEKYIHKSRQRQALLVEQSQLALIEWDTDWRVISWNPAAERIFGWTAAEAMGRYAYEFIVPEEVLGHVEQVWHDTFKRRENVQSTNENITKDGRRIICDWNNIMLVAPDGQVAGIASIAMDVTERKKAEDALRASESQLRKNSDALRESNATFQAIFDVSPLAISLLDMDGKVLMWNPASERIFGWTAQEVIGRTIPIIPPDRQKEFHEVLEKLFGNGKLIDQETVRQHKDGSLVDINLSTALIRDASGRPSARMGILHNITERKLAEEAVRQSTAQLRESEQKFRAFIEQNSEGVTLIDEQGRVIEWNHAMETITGVPRERALGMEYWDVQFRLALPDRRTPVRYEAMKKTLEEMLRVDKSQMLSGPIEAVIDRGGELVPIQQTVFQIKTAAGYRIGSVIRDITAQKYSEQQIQALNAELLGAYDATIEGWASALELRDRETEGHSRRVVEMTLELARRMGVPEEGLVHIRRGAILHDIGKMGIPDHILLKPGRLTDEEWVIMRQHPTYACQMLSGIPFLRPAIDIPYAHHEWWNGSGYPRSLKGEEIPLAARIFAVIDVWDALLNKRPYQPAWPRAEVIRHLAEGAGQHFDPQVVKAFLEMVGQ